MENDPKQTIPAPFINTYLFDKGYSWEEFEFLSNSSVTKKEIIANNLRFGETIEISDVKIILRAFKLSFDEFIDEYAKSLKNAK